MRILIDECVDQRLRFMFAGHDCETAAYARLSGLKNGALLAAAEAGGFEIIITRLADLKLLVPTAIEALDGIRAGQVIRIA